MKRFRRLMCLLILAFPPCGPALAELDGSFGEPELVARLTPAERPFPSRLTPTARGALFFAVDPFAPQGLGDLWTSDGTAEGTLSLQPPGLFNLELYPTEGPLQHFQARDGEDRLSWWRTDGTAAGTFELAKDVEIVAAIGYDAERRLFFATVNDTTTPFDAEPWVSDGTAAGTRLLKDLKAGPDGASAGPLVPFAGRWYFRGPAPDDGSIGVWETDGTPAGTRFVVDGARDLWSAAGSLYLLRLDGEGHLILHRSDGTEGGTVAIHDFGLSDPETLFPEVLLFGEPGGGRVVWLRDSTIPPFATLWATNGQAGQGALLLELDSSPLTSAQRLGGELYFLARARGRGLELWKSDGTPAGTRIAVERCPGPCSGFAETDPQRVAGDRLFLYSGEDPQTGIEPLITDGTPAGTETLGDLCPGPCSSAVVPMATDLGGALLFPARRDPATNDRNLVAWDFSSGAVVEVTSFAGGAFDTAVSGETLFLAADEGGRSYGLWKLALPDLDPTPPAGPWSSDPALPGFEAKVRISFAGASRGGKLEAECIAETLCFSGALPGRTEVFVRVVGPKPNGRLWPTLTKFTTSTVEVWLRQLSTGEVKYYRLEGARPGFDELPGLFDRRGFAP